jgi:hypothetical protein
MDSFPSNHKKGYKKRQSKNVVDEEDEEEAEEPEEFKAAPFFSDPEEPDPEYDPKVKFPLPMEVEQHPLAYLQVLGALEVNSSP